MASFGLRGFAPAFVLLLGCRALMAVAGDAAPQVAPDRQAELVRMVRHDCGSCHGMSLQGGLGPPLAAEALAGRPLDELESMILNGRPGTAMPAWQGLLGVDEARWIAWQLKHGFPDER
jgi:cytochrome c55X